MRTNYKNKLASLSVIVMMASSILISCQKNLPVDGLESFKPNNQVSLPFESEPMTMGSKANDILDESKRIAEIQEISAIQIQNRFIVAQAKNGLMLIDQRAAYERILY